MVKVLFALAKYLTDDLFNHLCRAVVLQISHTCCKHQVSTIPNGCSSCFKQNFPFLLEGENIHNYYIKSIASSHYFIKSVTSSCSVEDTPGYTLVHTLIRNNSRPLVGCLENSGRKVKQFGCLENPNSEYRIVANSEQRIVRIVRIVTNTGE